MTWDFKLNIFLSLSISPICDCFGKQSFPKDSNIKYIDNKIVLTSVLFQNKSMCLLNIYVFPCPTLFLL